MRYKWLSDYWQGLLLGIGSIVASIWLGITGKLTLYIHPRYVWFTLIMSVLALAVIMIDVWRQQKTPAVWRRKSLAGVALGVVCTLLCISLLITKPSALTSSTVSQRGINSGALDLAARSSVTTQLPSNVDFTTFTVKEWASLLSQTADPSFFAGKKVDITGFISPNEDNPNQFYVSRFILTCCAVDARPIGVPVHQPNWRSLYNEDQWVRVQGEFMSDTSGSTPSSVVDPSQITKTNQPDDPYVH